MIFPDEVAPFLRLILSDSILSSDVFPAPDDPIIYVVELGIAYPETLLRILCLPTLLPVAFLSSGLSNTLTSYSRFSNVSFTCYWANADILELSPTLLLL